MPHSPEEAALRQQLSLLRQEHQDLDSAIAALTSDAPFDQLQVQRLKKKKLKLRDEIARIEDQLVPDIIA
ncbi:MAG: YdcH family protein [Sphingomonadales bacterium]